MNDQKNKQVEIEQKARNRAFMDRVLELGKYKNDAAMARGLKILPPAISKIRNGITSVSPAQMVVVHEALGMSFAEMREYIPKESA